MKIEYLFGKLEAVMEVIECLESRKIPQKNLSVDKHDDEVIISNREITIRLRRCYGGADGKRHND